MTAIDILARLRTLGLEVTACDGSLRLVGTAIVPGDLVAAIRERRAEVLELLEEEAGVDVEVDQSVEAHVEQSTTEEAIPAQELPEQRRDVVARLREKRWSTRQIAEALGVDQNTVHRDLSTVPEGTVESHIISQDGKFRPSTRPAPEALESRRDRAQELREQQVDQADTHHVDQAFEEEVALRVEAFIAQAHLPGPVPFFTLPGSPATPDGCLSCGGTLVEAHPPRCPACIEAAHRVLALLAREATQKAPEAPPPARTGCCPACGESGLWRRVAGPGEASCVRCRTSVPDPTGPGPPPLGPSRRTPTTS